MGRDREHPVHHRRRSITMHDLHHKEQMTMRIRYVEYWCLHIYEYVHVVCRSGLFARAYSTLLLKHRIVFSSRNILA